MFSETRARAISHDGAAKGRSVAICYCLLALTALLLARPVFAQNVRELASLDMWIVERYRGAQLLPDSGTRSLLPATQAGAPRVESARRANTRDTVVALHFGNTPWRPVLGNSTPVQFADPTGSISGISGRVTARRAFRTPRVPGARDTVKDDWRVGWAYLVAIPSRAANATTSGLNGWALVETPKPAVRNASARAADVRAAEVRAADVRSQATRTPTPPETTVTTPPRSN